MNPVTAVGFIKFSGWQGHLKFLRFFSFLLLSFLGSDGDMMKRVEEVVCSAQNPSPDLRHFLYVLDPVVRTHESNATFEFVGFDEKLVQREFASKYLSWSVVSNLADLCIEIGRTRCCRICCWINYRIVFSFIRVHRDIFHTFEENRTSQKFVLIFIYD